MHNKLFIIKIDYCFPSEMSPSLLSLWWQAITSSESIKFFMQGYFPSELPYCSDGKHMASNFHQNSLWQKAVGIICKLLSVRITSSWLKAKHEPFVPAVAVSTHGAVLSSFRKHQHIRSTYLPLSIIFETYKVIIFYSHLMYLLNVMELFLVNVRLTQW